MMMVKLDSREQITHEWNENIVLTIGLKYEYTRTKQTNTKKPIKTYDTGNL